MMVQCPACARQQQPRLICEQCGAPLPAELDYFTALGCPRLPTLDLAKLESNYHELGRKIHPDRFAASPVAVRDASLKGTALLTRSYRTLKDPVSRGLYWLQLRGEKLAADNKAVPQDLAELVFDVQEQLSELRIKGQDRHTRDQLRGEVKERRTELGNLFERALADLMANFEQWSDNGAAQRQRQLTAQLKQVLSKIAYLRTLLRDVDRELEPAPLN